MVFEEYWQLVTSIFYDMENALRLTIGMGSHDQSFDLFEEEHILFMNI